MTDAQIDDLAKRAFMKFQLRRWHDSLRWDNVEPWERAAWREVTAFIASETIDELRKVGR